jgi:hypothetical protein
MDPAFSSNRQAAGFAALLAVILLLPLLAGKSLLPERAEIYKSIPWRFGGHPCFQKTICEEKKPLDIALIGSSRIWCGVDPVHLRDELSTSLGRQAEVRTLGWNTAGFDALYFIAKDLLENREVKLLVVNDEFNPEIGGDAPHRLASRWFRFGDNAEDLADLELGEQAGYYASAVLGMPRNLLGITRSPLPVRSSPANDFSPQNLYRTTDPEFRLGALRTEENYLHLKTAFIPFQPRASATPADVVTWSGGNRALFGMSEASAPDLQLHFARKLANLARKHKATLLFIHFPSLKDTASDKILEAAIWPDLLGQGVDHAGIPAASLFKGMTEAEITALFSDEKHLNRNGQEYFTPIIAPAIIRAYHEIPRR